ncbi:MAG: Oligoendopeptidase F, plasmid [Alphaproteobacteria bacterium MarineAlpha5_Bin9]|nr:MAG: Oligoendopeptidase F, plasmid [Alphaproteobacteria bacterium MarineAlpha5_Bin9]|tara:strand:- start:1822 stop:3627 length:1806 start_codon:yes stop_codon:yes gene_type:complete
MKTFKNNRINTRTPPIWNLDDLYKSINSPDIQKDLQNIKKNTLDFKKKYEGKIASCKADELYLAIKIVEKIDEKIDKVLSYAHLKFTENMTDEKNKIFFQQIKERITEYSSSLVFFSLEINAINNSKLKKLFRNNKLIKYKTWIENSRSYKPYQLNKKLEKFLREKNVTSNSAWIRLFDETIANLKFKFKNKYLSSSEIFNFLSDANHINRKAAAKSIGKTLSNNINLFSIITNTLAKDKSINDQWRKFPNPVRSRNLSNVVEDEVVNALCDSVKNSYSSLSHRYYLLKAKWFNKNKLKYWDRNAPLPFQSNKIYSWNEASEIVLKAFSGFNSEIEEIASLFFKKNWIHAKIQKGKSPGAFSASTVPSVHPYILLNFQGKQRDVSTLAHELGHGVHQYLAAKHQGHFNSATPLTVAETASVFSEMLTFKLLLRSQKQPLERKALLANKVEDMLNTVVRQIAFFEFEKKLHLERISSELSNEEICNIWLETQKESLGPGIEFDEEYKYYWSYIPHFIHSPFYVYAYAFGDCLVNSLYALYEEGHNFFEKKYISLLKSGGSIKYKQLLKPFNLDPSNSNFWNKGLSIIESLIDEIELIQRKDL